MIDVDLVTWVMTNIMDYHSVEIDDHFILCNSYVGNDVNKRETTDTFDIYNDLLEFSFGVINKMQENNYNFACRKLGDFWSATFQPTQESSYSDGDETFVMAVFRAAKQVYV